MLVLLVLLLVLLVLVLLVVLVVVLLLLTSELVTGELHDTKVSIEFTMVNPKGPKGAAFTNTGTVDAGCKRIVWAKKQVMMLLVLLLLQLLLLLCCSRCHCSCCWC